MAVADAVQPLPADHVRGLKNDLEVAASPAGTLTLLHLTLPTLALGARSPHRNFAAVC